LGWNQSEDPQSPYRETIKGRTKIQGKYNANRRSGSVWDTWLEIEPLPRAAL